MTKYSKLVATIVGLVILILNRHYGTDLSPFAPEIVDVILAALTAWGVYMLPNKERRHEIDRCP